jgi:cytochrome c oxidase subunit 3
MSASSAIDPARSPVNRSTGPFGVVLFLASDLMLFAPFFAAYFLLRSTNTSWPPDDVHLDALRAALATIVLIASSFTMIAVDRAQEHGDTRSMRRWLMVTITLGLVFLGNQVAEYATLDFAADDHVYGSVYWGLTGLHALHVTAGVCALALLFIRAARTRDVVDVAPWTAGVSLFWHLVDIVWIAVFVTIWVIR